MAEPTSALSFYNMLLRVAEKAGMAYYGTDGQQKAMVPIDAYNFDRCKRACNDGFRLFLASPPLRGWHWRNRTASILLDPQGDGGNNISSDAARYMLPADFGGFVSGRIEYVADTNHGTQISWCDQSFIRGRRAHTVQTGYPRYAAYLPYQPTAGILGASRRWELIVDPAPVAADTLEFPYMSMFNKLDAEAGIATGGTAQTLADSTREEANDYFNTWILTIVAGTGKTETATITDYTGATGTFTFTALSGGSTPDATSVYYVEPAANLHPAGFMFDDAVMAACLAETEKQIDEVNEGLVELFYKIHLPNAHLIDGLSRPRSVGNMSRPPRHFNRRDGYDVTTDHDI